MQCSKIFLNDEIRLGWCLGATWRCTPSEAIGLWSVLLFYTTIILVTVIHSALQQQTDSGTAAATRNEKATHRHSAGATNTVGDHDDWRIVCALLVYFFLLVVGSLLWALKGVRWVHPVQIWEIQLLGAALLVACAFCFVIVHVQLGQHWSPIPEPNKAALSQLVTRGIYRYARHPMYAVFLWAAIGTCLATLNWLIAWCVFGLVGLTLRRIETEERMLVELLGSEYLEYRRQVSALGPPWHCLGLFDDNWMMPTPLTQAKNNSHHQEYYGYGAMAGTAAPNG